MNQDVIDEREYVAQFREKNLQGFYNWVKMYDAYMYQLMKIAGWQPAFSKERTVIFTFGEVTYLRRVYRKGNKYRYPVDEKLGLKKNERYSRELLYQILELSKFMAYRQIPKIIEMMYQVIITKDTVCKVIAMTTELFNERDEYRYYEEYHDIQKVKTDVIYVEGDGVLVHTKIGDKRWSDLAHFVIHTGSRKVGKCKNRTELMNKREVISTNWKDAIQKLTETITNHYDIENCQLIVTNSDGGHGYTPYVFKELARTLKIKHHEHFWDEYHLNKKIKQMYKGKNLELRDLLFKAIHTHNKKDARLALNTQESLLMEEDEEFSKFTRRLLEEFQYTTPAHLRKLTHKGIGVMESQHTKITIRMKNRKMYWGLKGANTMSRMLIMDSQELRDLWFGSWRQEFEKYKDLPENISDYLKRANEEYMPYQGIVHMVDRRSKFRD